MHRIMKVTIAVPVSDIGFHLFLCSSVVNGSGGDMKICYSGVMWVACFCPIDVQNLIKYHQCCINNLPETRTQRYCKKLSESLANSK